jgi:signal transduction histidine kinase
LIALIVTNLALLGVVQTTSWVLQRDWLTRNRRIYQEQVHDSVLRSAFGSEVGNGRMAPNSFLRRLLGPEVRRGLRAIFRDAVIAGRAADGAWTEISPLGASVRDHTDFPIESIRRGMRAAIADGELRRVGSGFCLPIEVGGHSLGGAWFAPILPPPPELPMSAFAVPLLLGTAVFGMLAYWWIGRGVLRPLREFGAVAKAFGEGRYDLRMPHAPELELRVFSSSFNAMAERIEGHHELLQREVSRATEEARRGERVAVQSARLAAMGTLAAGIAHEINNPIGGMLNAVRRLEERAHLEERERVYLGLVRDGLERVARIARKVLDFSPRAVEARPFGLSEAVEGARALVEHRIHNLGVIWDAEVGADLPSLTGDRHEFQQVVLNLLINSLDVLEGWTGPRRIEVRAHVENGSLTLRVADTGPGMAPELLPRVMDPFFSGKGRPDASGLGMFISYSIVRNHGGTMEIESAPGRGFATTIRLPVGQDAT